MEYYEISPLPKACKKCKESDCGSCDFAGLRWRTDPNAELLAKKSLKEQAILRLQKEIQEIERQIEAHRG